MAMRDGDDGFEGIVRAVVDIAGLQPNDGGSWIGGECLFQRGRLKAATRVGGERDHLRPAESEQAGSAFERSVPFTARENLDGRRAVQALLFYIPSPLFEQRMPCRSEAS